MYPFCILFFAMDNKVKLRTIFCDKHPPSLTSLVPKFPLTVLLKKFEMYTVDDCFVYKSCTDKFDMCDRYPMRWLIIMKKLKFTATNENRESLVDDRFATHTADILEVVTIVNVE